MLKFSPRTIIAAGLAGTLGVAVATTLVTASADSGANYPADKMTVSGASFDVMGPTATGADPAAADPGHLLLEAHMRTSSTEDLILNVSAECDILTQIHNAQNDATVPEHSAAQVKMWITIDGTPVPVAADDTTTGDVGKVVFCNRTHDATSSFDNSDEFYQAYLDTRAANAFEWVALNVGNGVHDIKLFADFTAEVAGANMSQDLAKAAVGKRTLVVEPTKAAHNEVNDTGITP